MAKLETLHDVFLHGLYDLYDAEQQLTDALPKMADASSSPKLKKAFKEHLQQTKEHVKRLERTFESLQEKPRRITCKGMEGLIKEGDEVIKAGPEGAALDAALIFAAQKVEHYEISSYGSLAEYATMMKHRGALKYLKQTLKEEKKADDLLTKIGTSSVNEKANNM